MNTTSQIIKIIHESGDRFMVFQYLKKDGENRSLLVTGLHNDIAVQPKEVESVLVFDVLENKPKRLLTSGIQSIQSNQLYTFNDERNSDKGSPD